ncbi:MAG: monovalent cation/H(+) antiporter subunit G [Fimbriimonadales bacterium]
MTLTELMAGLLIFMGSFVFVVAGIGIVRFPDFYSRVHPAGNGDTLGLPLVLIGLMVYEGFTQTSLKILLVLIFLLLTGPVASHALARSAFLTRQQEENHVD